MKNKLLGKLWISALSIAMAAGQVLQVSPLYAAQEDSADEIQSQEEENFQEFSELPEAEEENGDSSLTDDEPEKWTAQTDESVWSAENVELTEESPELEEDSSANPVIPEMPVSPNGQRDLISEGLLEIEPWQLRELFELDLHFDQDYQPQPGDYFEFTVPAGIELCWLGETIRTDEFSNYKAVILDRSVRVWINDKAKSLPEDVPFCIKRVEEYLIQAGSLVWSIHTGSDTQTDFVLNLDYLASKPVTMAGKRFTLDEGDFTTWIVKSGDEKTLSLWAEISRIKKPASGKPAATKELSYQGQVLKEIRTALNEPINKILPGRTNTNSLSNTVNLEYICEVLRDYLIKKANYYPGNMYELPDDGQTAYSALVGGQTVCSGYAHAFTLCTIALKSLGTNITSYMVSSYSGFHSFNVVLLGNYYYLIDITRLESGLPKSKFFLVGNNTIKGYTGDEKNLIRLFDITSLMTEKWSMN